MDYKNIQRHICMALLLWPLFSATTLAATNEKPTLESDKQLFSRAVELSSQAQWVEVESIYRDLLERNSDWPEPKNNLAILLLKTNRLDEAKQMLEQAVVSSPSYRIAQHNRTQLYNFLATQAYDKALGTQQTAVMPDMELIQEIYHPVKIIEKIIEKKVEVLVEQPLSTHSENQQAIIHKDKNSQDIATGDDVESVIKQQLVNWSDAWTEGDFEQYIQNYSQQFVPSDTRKSLIEWKNIRRGRLRYSKGVNVNIEQLRVFRAGQGQFALVEFVQHYQSASYADKVLKQMYMEKQQNQWLILSERIIKTY